MAIRLILIFSLIAFASCDSAKKKETAKSGDANGQVKELFFKSGKLRASIPMKDGKKHGKAIEYYENGKLFQEIEYKEGLKEGWARTYFEKGQLAQETFYEGGIKNGVQRKFRETGKTSSEATFYHDKPCVGLKEYLLDDSLKKKYPTLVIQPIDEVATKGLYTLQISLSEKTRDVEFYLGDLGEHGEVGSSASRIWETGRKGVAELPYRVLPGTFVMETVNIVAVVKTTLGNSYITQRKFNVAAESR